ncbi:MAG TPA: AAA family ATPase [Steroidobacteraceae bacterium]|nr:AAA family ATPase [Steroidobacteraceae bacterium]
MARRRVVVGEGSALPGSPFLTSVGLKPEKIEPDAYPFTLPLIGSDFGLKLSTPVTFLVGENGAGKSTLLEALAWAAGFNASGGHRDQSFVEGADGHKLGRALRMGWRQRVSGGFFLRAETFFNFATYLEEVGSTFSAYGGKSLHAQSHGEAFLALFSNNFEDGLFILDEPEAALSPQRQLSFLRILNALGEKKVAQFIIATHSPILLTLPGARVLSVDGGALHEVDYRDTEHFRLTRDFLNAPERFFRHLLADEGDVADDQ